MALSSIMHLEGAQKAESLWIAARTELLPISRGPFVTRTAYVDFGDLWMHQVDVRASYIRHTSQPTTRAFFRFLSKPGMELISHGVSVPFGSIIRYSLGQEYNERSRGPVQAGDVSLPVETISSFGIALAGCDLAPTRNPILANPLPHTMARFQSLHAAAAALAESNPDVLARAGPAHAIEQSLIEALIHCLVDPDLVKDTIAQQHHRVIMKRFRRMLEANPDRPLYLPEVCASIGVSERTLRMSCQEHLGLSPTQYLTLRRLMFAQRALRAATPGQVSVTDVATQYGFWHFSRFAGHYRSLFGESPSATLRRSPE